MRATLTTAEREQLSDQVARPSRRHTRLVEIARQPWVAQFRLTFPGKRKIARDTGQ